MDLTEAEDIKKRWQEYTVLFCTEELYEKELHDPDNRDGVITHLEPDNLEFEVKWALGGMQVKKQQLELDMEQQTGSKLGKYVKAVYCHPAYLIFMQSTSSEMPEWMKHKLESRLLGEISIISDTQMTPLL